VTTFALLPHTRNTLVTVFLAKIGYARVGSSENPQAQHGWQQRRHRNSV
jgi:hypothetical protein